MEPLKIKKILIVEDEMIIARVYQMYLEFNGFEVVGIAMNAVQGISMFQQFQPDLVVMDIQLAQNTSGIFVANEIKKISDTRIIFTTGMPPDQLNEAMNEIEDAEVLIKPIENEFLLQTILRIIPSPIL